MPLTEEQKQILRDAGYTEAQIAVEEAKADSATSTTTSTTSTKTTKPSTVTYPSISSVTQANDLITKTFGELLDRSPTAGELKSWRKKLNAAEKEFASKQTYKRKGAEAQQATVGGLDKDFWLTDAISKDPTYSTEVQRLAILDPKIRQKEKDKREYEAAVKAAGDNPAALANLDATTTYGIEIKSLFDSIKATATAAGSTLDDNALLEISREAYDQNKDLDRATLTSFVNSKLKIIGADGYKGKASNNYQELLEIGVDNGVNIATDPRFKGQIDAWLTQINQGVSIDDFANVIRNTVAQGQPAFVRDLLKIGQNLSDIYGNYVSRMAKFFDLDASTIDLNDPLLKKVFTDKGGMSFSVFESELRKDKRFAGAEKVSLANDRQGITDRAVELGIELTETDIDDITNTAASLNISISSPTIDRLIRNKFNYTPGKAFGGKAGETIASLRATAAANGIDLDTQFGAQLDSWVERVMQGESSDTFKNVIRQTAKIGLPQNVGKLLDEGVDLDTVYSPYRNMMAKVLEINPETIRLDDPVLRSAITSQGETSLYDYQRQLRKDVRWQYTDNAREDVSNAALQILRDFGFQG
jgi:hypothetical protein